MATIEFENAVRIERPVEDVFGFVADPENIPKWNYFVLEVKKTSDGELGVGSTYHQVRKTDEQDLRMEAYDVNRRVVLATVPPSKPRLEREMLFEVESSSTMLDDRWKLELRGLQRLVSRRAQSAVEQNLQVLKHLMEASVVYHKSIGTSRPCAGLRPRWPSA